MDSSSDDAACPGALDASRNAVSMRSGLSKAADRKMPSSLKKAAAKSMQAPNVLPWPGGAKTHLAACIAQQLLAEHCVRSTDMEEPLRCAICLEAHEFAALPCCETGESTTRFCVECLRLLCGTMGLGGVGRCPKCREWIAVDGDTVVLRDAVLRCGMCLQPKVIVDRGLCDACLFGLQRPLRYECESCRRFQYIPHPMYRYQAEPAAFSNVTWACQRCGDYTHWRIAPFDLARVPDADAPAAWNREMLAFERVRRLRLQHAEARGQRPDANARDQRPDAEVRDQRPDAEAARGQRPADQSRTRLRFFVIVVAAFVLPLVAARYYPPHTTTAD